MVNFQLFYRPTDFLPFGEDIFLLAYYLEDKFRSLRKMYACSIRVFAVYDSQYLDRVNGTDRKLSGENVRRRTVLR